MVLRFLKNLLQTITEMMIIGMMKDCLMKYLMATLVCSRLGRIEAKSRKKVNTIFSETKKLVLVK